MWLGLLNPAYFRKGTIPHQGNQKVLAVHIILKAISFPHGSNVEYNDCSSS
jgi:hypothetical protein